MSGPTVTIDRTTREITLTRSSLGLQGVPGDTGAAGPAEVSTDAGQLLVLGTDDRVLATATEITPAAIGAATAAQGGTADTAVQPEDMNICAVSVQGGSYTLLTTDSVVVFTATATASLPAATGSGLTYRIICRAGTLTVDPNGAETVKGAATATLSAGEDLILTDTSTGIWE